MDYIRGVPPPLLHHFFSFSLSSSFLPWNFWDSVSCRPNWPQIHYVAKDGLELLILLSRLSSVEIPSMCHHTWIEIFLCSYRATSHFSNCHHSPRTWDQECVCSCTHVILILLRSCVNSDDRKTPATYQGREIVRNSFEYLSEWQETDTH